MTEITFVLRIELGQTTLAALAMLLGRVPTAKARVSGDAHHAVGDAPAVTQTPPATREKKGGWISDERDALLRELIPTMTPMNDILSRVNALRGAPATKTLIRSRAAGVLKLRRPPEVTPPHLRANLAVRHAAKAAPPPSSEDVPAVKEEAPDGGGAVTAAPAPVRETPQRKSATRQQIIDFCRGRGWTVDQFDIGAINKRLDGLGHPGFTLIEPAARRIGRAA